MVSSTQESWQKPRGYSPLPPGPVAAASLSPSPGSARAPAKPTRPSRRRRAPGCRTSLLSAVQELSLLPPTRAEAPQPIRATTKSSSLPLRPFRLWLNSSPSAWEMTLSRATQARSPYLRAEGSAHRSQRGRRAQRQHWSRPPPERGTGATAGTALGLLGQQRHADE